MIEKYSLVRLFLSALGLLALNGGMELPAQEIKQTQADSYTRYELLDPAGSPLLSEIVAPALVHRSV